MSRIKIVLGFLVLGLVICRFVVPSEAAAPARAKPYVEEICRTNPDVFFCEDFEGDDIKNLGSNNCGSTWDNPAILQKDICWAGGGSYQRATIATPGMGPSNKVWRITKGQSFKDIVTGIDTGIGNGTIAGWLRPEIMGSGAREWYMRAQVYFSPDTTWPADLDYKHALWALPRVFTDPPSAPYEAGLFLHQDFWCGPNYFPPSGQTFADAPLVRYSNNFQQFPYQNEYCPPLAPGAVPDNVHAMRYQKGRWYTVEIHYKLGSSSSGKIEMWVDGKLALSTNRATCVGACSDMGYIMILGWMNSADPQSGYLEVDNVVYSRSYIGPPVAQGSAPPAQQPPPPPVAQYTLSLSSLGQGMMVATPPPTNGTYAAGTVVAVTATPAAGWTFSGWVGSCVGTGACSFAMAADRSLVANFVVSPPPPPPSPPSVVDQPPAGTLSVARTCNIAVTVKAQDDKGVASVQIKLDGVSSGAAASAPPYIFNRSNIATGSQVTAVITDSIGQKTTVGPSLVICP